MTGISKKYSFSVLAFACILFTLIFCSTLKDLPLYSFIAAIMSSQLSIALITIAYITGQAKIDIQATAQAGVGVKHDD